MGVVAFLATQPPRTAWEAGRRVVLLTQNPRTGREQLSSRRARVLLQVLQRLGLDLPQAQRRERLLKKPFTPVPPVQLVLTVTVAPVPAGATVQLVTIDELASFSITVLPATSTSARTSRDP